MNRLLIIAALCLSIFAPVRVPAQDAAAPPAAELSARQLQVYRDFERFEKSLFEVAEQMRVNDPDHAQLLYRARTQSQEQNILNEMTLIAELLRTQTPAGAPASPRYGPAADRQEELLARMTALLTLLQSLDEGERLRAEIRLLEENLKLTNRLIARQKDVRADTERGKPGEQLSPAEQKVIDEAKALADKLDAEEAKRRQENPGRQPPGENPSGQNPPGESPPPDGSQGKGEQQPGQQPPPGEQPPGDKPPEQQQPAEKPPEGEQPSGQPPQGEQPSGETPPQNGQQPSQPPQDGQQQDGQQQPGQQPPPGQQPQQKQPEQEQPPGREQLEQARRAMQQALEQLQQNRQEQALGKEDEAVDRLEELKAELEKILRQLRQDERESYLTMLEARFQNMLKRQQGINGQTARLDKIPDADHAQQNYAAQVDEVRKEQGDNALEAEKALRLLKEDGSSVAFPEAVEQMHSNMLLVVQRLARQDTGTTTQTIENLIVQTLEEMIGAMREELEENRKEQEGRNGQQQQQGSPADPGLVKQIAELKLIRSLQLQINVLTTSINDELQGQPAADPARREVLDDLARRQDRLQQATYDLSTGRNE